MLSAAWSGSVGVGVDVIVVGGGFRRGAVRALVWRAARMVLAEMLVEDGLEGEAFAADVAMEGLVSRVLADVVLQLVLARVLFSAHATHKRCDAHVQPHVTIKAALLVEGLAAVDTGEARVVAEPAITYLLTQVLLIPSHIKHSCFLSLQGRKPKMSSLFAH